MGVAPCTSSLCAHHAPTFRPTPPAYISSSAQNPTNNQNTPLPYDFVTTFLRGRTDGFVLKGGDATKGTLTTMYDGVRPFVFNNRTTRGYQPMKKQGAIILATGGDNSNSAMGAFYEGYMVSAGFISWAAS